MLVSRPESRRSATVANLSQQIAEPKATASLFQEAYVCAVSSVRVMGPLLVKGAFAAFCVQSCVRGTAAQTYRDPVPVPDDVSVANLCWGHPGHVESLFQVGLATRRPNSNYVLECGTSCSIIDTATNPLYWNGISKAFVERLGEEAAGRCGMMSVSSLEIERAKGAGLANDTSTWGQDYWPSYLGRKFHCILYGPSSVVPEDFACLEGFFEKTAPLDPEPAPSSSRFAWLTSGLWHQIATACLMGAAAVGVGYGFARCNAPKPRSAGANVERGEGAVATAS